MSSYTERQARIENKFSSLRAVNRRYYRALSYNARFDLRPLFEITYRTKAHNNTFFDRASRILIGKSYKMNYARPNINELSAKSVL